jgi:hypothetical protein
VFRALGVTPPTPTNLTNTNKDTAMTDITSPRSTADALKHAMMQGAKQGSARSFSRKIAQVVVMRYSDQLPQWFGTPQGMQALELAIPGILHFILTSGPGNKLPKAALVAEMCELGMTAAASDAVYDLINKVMDGFQADGMWDALTNAAEEGLGKAAPQVTSGVEEDRLKAHAAAEKSRVEQRQL